MDDFTRKRRMSLHILVVTAITAIAWMAVGVGPAHATTPGAERTDRVPAVLRRCAHPRRDLHDPPERHGAHPGDASRARSRTTISRCGRRMASGSPFTASRRASRAGSSRFDPTDRDLTLLSLDPSAGEDGYPAWSPNGKRIAFHRFNDSTGLDALFVMRADGTHVRQIPGTGHYRRPRHRAVFPRRQSPRVRGKHQEGFGRIHHPPRRHAYEASDTLGLRRRRVRLVSRRSVAPDRVSR